MSSDDRVNLNSSQHGGQDDLPEQLHAGKVGYGPNYHAGPTLEEKIGGIKEELLGKIHRNPDRVQHGQQIRSGEDRRKKLTGDDEPNPFQVANDDKSQERQGDPPATATQSRPSGPASSQGGGGGGFISDQHARDLYDHHDVQHEERLAKQGTAGANPQGMSVGQGYGKGAKEQAATIAPQGTKEAEYQRKGEAVDRVKHI